MTLTRELQSSPANRLQEPRVKPVMNLDEVVFDDVEENGCYTSSRGQISDHIGYALPAAGRRSLAGTLARRGRAGWPRPRAWRRRAALRVFPKASV